MEKIKFVNTDGLAYNNAMNKMLDRERRKSFSSFINNEYCWGIGFDILRRFKYTNPDLRPYSEIDEILGIKVIRILYHADDTSKICLTNYVNDCMPIMIASRGSGKTYTQFKYLDEMMKKWNRGVVNNNQSIKNVIFNDPATIMFWTDGTKTVVKAENEPFDPEKGLAMAIIKKLFGTNESKSNYNDIFKKWIKEEEVPEFLNKKMNVSEDKKYHTVKDAMYMSVKQYANMTGMSKSTIIRHINSGKIFGAKKDKTGKWLIPIPIVEV